MSETPPVPEVPAEIRARAEKAGVTPDMAHDEAYARLAVAGFSDEEADRWARALAQPPVPA